MLQNEQWYRRVAELCKTLRLTAGIDQGEMAKQCKNHQPAISALELHGKGRRLASTAKDVFVDIFPAESPSFPLVQELDALLAKGPPGRWTNVIGSPSKKEGLALPREDLAPRTRQLFLAIQASTEEDYETTTDDEFADMLLSFYDRT